MRRSEISSQLARTTVPHRLRFPLLAALAMLIAGVVAGQDLAPPADEFSPYLFAGPRADTPSERLLESLLEEHGSTDLADLTVADLATVLDLLSIAEQEHEHIRRSARLSWFTPGLGHYINGKTGAAVAFAAADLLTVGATLAFGYLLLPPAVQSRNLNYLQSSFLVIQERWEQVTPYELIPSLAVYTGGAILSMTIRGFAARNARVMADNAVQNGIVRFEPLPAGGLAR